MSDIISDIKFYEDEIKKLNKEVTGLKKEKEKLISEAQEKDVLSNEKYSLVIKEVNSSRIDQELLREKYPEIAKEVTITNKYNKKYIKDNKKLDKVMEETVKRMRSKPL